MDAVVLRTFVEPISGSGGASYVAKICGRRRGDNLWEGWVEFVPEGGTPVLRSRRETTQPNRRILEGWAGRLSRTYLQGALERTLETERPRARPPGRSPEPPHFEGPAPDLGPGRRPAPDDAAVNPFIHYRQGEDALAEKLEALSASELRTVVRAYDLDQEARDRLDVDTLERRELVALVVGAVRARMKE